MDMKHIGHPPPPLWPPDYDHLESPRLKPTPNLNEPIQPLTPDELDEARIVLEYEQQLEALRAQRGY